MKKLFALVAVFSLVAIGCDDKKSTKKVDSAATGGTYVKTNKVGVDTTVRVTDTVIVDTKHVADTKTVKATVTVPAGGDPKPKLPDNDKK